MRSLSLSPQRALPLWIARWAGTLTLPALLGGCFLLSADTARIAPPPRYPAAIRPLQYPGADGRPIEGLIALPSGPSAPVRMPCLLFLHGQIGLWRSYRPYALQLARIGYGVLYINYYSARVVDLKEGMRPFDERVRRLRLMLEDMARGVDALAEHPRCERRALTVAGFSLGGSYAFHVAALRPKKVATVVSFYGAYRFKPLMQSWDVRLSLLFGDEDWRRWTRWWTTHDPHALNGSVRAPVLLLHGRSDTWVPHRQAVDFHAARLARGLPTELVLLKGQEHDFMFNLNPKAGQVAVRRLVEFLERRVAASTRNGCPPGCGAGPPPPQREREPSEAKDRQAAP